MGVERLLWCLKLQVPVHEVSWHEGRRLVSDVVVVAVIISVFSLNRQLNELAN